jgi:hypothetical protein
MAVSGDYLKKIRTAIRRYSTMNADLTVELQDTIEECRADLIRLGISAALAASETDYHVLDAVKRYCRWAFEPEPDVQAQLWETYRLKADELRRMRDYAYLTIGFTVTDDSDTPIEDALITFNGESVYTDANGIAQFYYVEAAQKMAYSITADGYASVSDEVNVTASTGIAVEMEGA